MAEKKGGWEWVRDEVSGAGGKHCGWGRVGVHWGWDEGGMEMGRRGMGGQNLSRNGSLRE